VAKIWLLLELSRKCEEVMNIRGIFFKKFSCWTVFESLRFREKYISFVFYFDFILTPAAGPHLAG
jgi:hypothetical protein